MDILESFQFPIKYDTVAGGVVVFGRAVLLLFLSGRSEYRLPKGHIDKGETPLKAALREIGEESGYTHLKVQADLGIQTVEFDHYSKHIVRTEYYFLMSLEDQEDQTPSQGKFRPAWMPWTVALKQITYEGEREWLRRAQSVWNNLSTGTPPSLPRAGSTPSDTETQE
jgi:8-oxo-dGTP pyrophosphatase MutT (NUDIX family)